MWYPKIRIVEPEEGEGSNARRPCQVPGCGGDGDFRAPKSRYDLRDYYWFCEDHVREYNKNWDYFRGMSRGEIENHMYASLLGDRPTWRSTMAGMNEEKIRKSVYEDFRTGGEGDWKSGTNDDTEAKVSARHLPRPLLDALAVLDLEPPVAWQKVRARYKELAKKYHPDTNRGDKSAEERLKNINIAYSILKLAHDSF